MMVVELFLEMNGLKDESEDIQMPEHIKTWKSAKKLDWLLKFLDPMLDKIFAPFHAPNMDDIRLDIVIGNHRYALQLPPTFTGKEYQMQLDNGTIVSITHPADPDNVQSTSDQLCASSYGFFRAMMDFAMLDDIIHSGDIDRLTTCLKRLIPLFIGLHSLTIFHRLNNMYFLQ